MTLTAINTYLRCYLVVCIPPGNQCPLACHHPRAELTLIDRVVRSSRKCPFERGVRHRQNTRARSSNSPNPVQLRLSTPVIVSLYPCRNAHSIPFWNQISRTRGKVLHVDATYPRLIIDSIRGRHYMLSRRTISPEILASREPFSEAGRNSDDSGDISTAPPAVLDVSVSYRSVLHRSHGFVATGLV